MNTNMFLGLAAGVFVGNTLFWGAMGQWKRGLAIGSVAAILVLVIMGVKAIIKR